jgi:hypothetical protein
MKVWVIRQCLRGVAGPLGVAPGPETGPQRVEVATQALTSAFRIDWVQPLTKSTCSVFVDPVMVGVIETVSPAALDVG